jgi:hypothetical protein
MFASQIGTLPEKIAKALNELGGGNEAKPGNILGVETSVTPGTISNLIRSTTGGLGTFLAQSYDAAFGAEQVKASAYPVLSRFYGEVSEDQNVRLASDRMRQVRETVKVIEDQIKADIAPNLKDDERRIYAMADLQKLFYKEMADLRKEEIAVKRSKEMTDERKRLALDNIRAAQDKISSAVSRAYLRGLGPQKAGSLEVSTTP